MMLDTLYYGNSVQDWGISLLVIIGALLTNKLISMIIKKMAGSKKAAEQLAARSALARLLSTGQ